MPKITIDSPPTLNDPRLVAQWVLDQLYNIERALNTGLDSIQLVELNAEPERPRSGMIVLADGTNWNPGSGQGIYAYYNSSWNKLG